MTPEQFARVRAIFNEVAALPPHRRPARLRALAGRDADVVREVRSLLARWSQSSPVDGPVEVPESVLRRAAGDPPAGPEPRLAPATPLPGGGPAAVSPVRPPPVVDAVPRVHGYEVTGPLGEGGMGVVWSAVQLGTRRPVALKLMSAAALGSAKSRARFAREVELAAALQHPNIARVYDSGVHEGVYYYAMERVDGQPLDRFVAGRQLTARQTLGLVRRLCRAVQYAHQRGVIHRDLKPSNVLVSKDGQPHVLDFGLAKATAGDGAAAAVSVAGEVAGTPAYMSPEQAAGRTAEADTRSDVYTLGVIAYRLLTGRFPHDVGGSHLDVIRRVAEADPTPPRTARPDLGAEVEAILLKALARDPDERYQSAAGLADDLTRYLDGEPVVARPASLWYVARKRLRKHRGRVAAAAVAAAVLLATAVGAYARVVGEWRRAEAASAAERDARSALEAQAGQIAASRNEAVASRNEAVAAARKAQAAEAASAAAARLAEARRVEARRALADSLVAQGDAQAVAGRPGEAEQGYWDAYRVLNELGAPAAPAEAALDRAHDRSPPALLVLAGHGDAVICNAVSPDGRQALSGSKDKTVRLWDLQTGVTIKTLAGHTDTVRGVAFLPDGRQALSASEDQTVKLWDLRTGRELHTFEGHRGQVISLAVSPDGRRFLTGGKDQAIKLWDLAGRRELRTIGGLPSWVFAVAFSPDGQSAAAVTVELDLWDLNTGKLKRNLHRNNQGQIVSSVAFRPDGAAVLAGGGDSGSWPVRLWDVETGREIWRSVGHTGDVRGAAFHPSGRLAATASWDHTAKLWDVVTGAEVRTFGGHAGEVTAVSFTPDGTGVLTSSFDSTLRLWACPSSAVPPAAPQKVQGVEFGLGGRVYAVAVGSEIRVTDVRTRRPIASLRGHAGTVSAINADGDGSRIVSTANDGTVRVWDLRTRAEVKRLSGNGGATNCVATSADGRWAVTGGRDGTVKCWDLRAGTLTATMSGHDNEVEGVAISPDGARALSASWDKTVRLWDLRAKRELRVLAGHTEGVWAVAFSPDGRLGVSGSNDRTAKLWDLESGTALRTFSGHTSFVDAVAILPDGRSLLTVSSGDQTVKLWDVPTGQPIRTLSDPENGVRGLAVSPDGRRAAFRRRDGTVTSWDFSHARAYADREAQLRRAQDVLRQAPADPAALAALGDWYAFRNAPRLAVAVLERAREAGAAVDPLTLGRCYWELAGPPAPGDAPNDERTRAARVAARRELSAAEAKATDPAERAYLALCLVALGDPSGTAAAATRPATRPATGVSTTNPARAVPATARDRTDGG